jgi:small subunit ribosomal protein S2
MLSRERDKLEKALGGIKDMGGTPDLIFVIDTNKEAARDQGGQPPQHPGRGDRRHQLRSDGITYPVPGNDDAGRAIALYCDLIARAAIDGIGRGPGSSGIDLGASRSPDRRGAAGGRRRRRAAKRRRGLRALAAPRGAPDDLTKLQGVGPQLEKKLNDAGIFHFWQVAAMTRPTSPRSTPTSSCGRIGRDGWVEGARLIAA